MSLQHVRTLAVLQMSQGGLECAWGLVFACSPGGEGDYWIALSLAGLAAAFVGVLRFAAGLLNMFYRGRRLGMVVLGLGLLSGVTCLCLPTSLALAVYGFFVYTNADVRRAFVRRAGGASLDEVERPAGI